MNGTRIALVLGLAGLAGLGLATPGMLGTGAKPESAVPHPSAEQAAQSAPAPKSCTLVAEAAPVPECAAAAAEPAALAQAQAQPQAQAQAQTPRVGRVIYPVERPIATSASTPKNTAPDGQARIAPAQRKLLAQKQANGQLADGKVLPVGISAKEEALQAAERKRSGFAPDSSVAGRRADSEAAPATKSGTEAGKAEGMLIRTGKEPVQKLPSPK